jgi:hypothetical protein
LANTLVHKYQLNGNTFNALEMELQVKMLIEQIQQLTLLTIELSAGKYSDATMTEGMITRVDALVALLQQQMNTGPKLVVAGAGALPPRPLNGGGRH